MTDPGTYLAFVMCGRCGSDRADHEGPNLECPPVATRNTPKHPFTHWAGADTCLMCGQVGSEHDRTGREGDTNPIPTTSPDSMRVTPKLQTLFQNQGAIRDEPNEVTSGILDDLARRTELGIKRYGQPLMTRDGRDTILDAYEESLDQAQYLQKLVIENPDRPSYKIALWSSVGIVFFLKECLVHATKFPPA